MTDGLAGANTMSEPTNFPGFNYLERVIFAAGLALTQHGNEANSAWAGMQDGTYDQTKAMQAFARVVNGYYGVLVETLRAPWQLPRPAWAVIPYSKHTPPAPQQSIAIERALDSQVKLKYSPFQTLGGGTPPHIFDGDVHPNGARVDFRLADEAIKTLPVDSHHLGFIYEEGRGVVTPLLILVLHVVA
jgi:hypothetical protein